MAEVLSQLVFILAVQGNPALLQVGHKEDENYIYIIIQKNNKSKLKDKKELKK